MTPASRPPRGFTLIELMIAMALGLVAVAAVGSLFLAGSRSYRQDERITRTHDNLRFAMAQLTQDLEMAGFFAQVREPAAGIALDASLTGAGGYASSTCTAAWVFGERTAVEPFGNATPAQASAAYPCLVASQFQPGTDLVAVKRVRGACESAPVDGRYYLRTNGTLSTLYRHTTAAPPPPAGATCPAVPGAGGVEVYEYTPGLWFVRRHRTLPGDGIPSLCRKSLSGATLVSDCIADGIEDLQLELGLDQDGDGTADQYRSTAGAPGAAERDRIVALRVHLLARALDPDPDPAWRNRTSFTLGDRVHPAGADRYYRRALSTVVQLRNPASRVRPAGIAG